MLEKRLTEILNLYENQIKDLKLTPSVMEKLTYIHHCLDHIQNEIEELTMDSYDHKEENRIYKAMQKDLGPLMVWYIANNIQWDRSENK